MAKYIATQSVGQYRPGETVEGLSAERAKALLASGAIEAYQEPKPPVVDDTAERLADLEKANQELTAANKLMTDEKVKSDQENAELKAQVADLEKALKDAQAALKKATAEAKKADAQTEK